MSSDRNETGPAGLSADNVINALRPVQDPDLHQSIVDLGFIRNIRITGGTVRFDLQLTTPACPMKELLRRSCVNAVSALPGVADVIVNLTARTLGAQTDGREKLKQVGNVVAVASGKGGVGKSTTAVNLAVALSQAGAKTGLLDADIYGPSIPTMLHVDQPAETRSDSTIVPARSHGIKIVSIGFFVQPGQAAIMRGPMASGMISHFVGNVDWGELDYLIVDYPPGTGDIQLTLSQQAPISGAVITTTPQDISLVDVERAIGMFERTGVPVLGVCETMSYFICDGCRKKHHIFRDGGGQRIAAKTGVPFLGEIPIDPQVSTSGDTGVPIVIGHPESEVARAYRDMSGAVAAQLSILNAERGHYLENFSLEWKS